MGGQTADIACYKSACLPSSRLHSPQWQSWGHAGQCLPQICMLSQQQASQPPEATMLRSLSSSRTPTQQQAS